MGHRHGARLAQSEKVLTTVEISFGFVASPRQPSSEFAVCLQESAEAIGIKAVLFAQ